VLIRGKEKLFNQKSISDKKMSAGLQNTAAKIAKTWRIVKLLSGGKK